MIKRLAMIVLLTAIVLSAAVSAADEQLIYTGDFVSIGGTTKLCAQALGDGVGVPDVGVWFQAWNWGGIPRFPGPSATLFTNELGNVCTLKTLNSGLYTVQAFGATGEFDGLASSPVVVASLTTHGGYLSFGSAGVGENKSPSGLREVALGVYKQALGTPSPTTVVLKQIVVLDPHNPDGPTRVTSTVLFSNSWAPPNSGCSATGFCNIQIGDSMHRALLNLELSVKGRLTPSFAVPGAPAVITGTGAFEVNVTALSGQLLYEAFGSFTGQAGLYWAF